MQTALIIGGGIAGLTTAIALREVGVDCKVFEAAPEMKRVGAGLLMASNAMQVYGKLGLAQRILETGVELKSFSVRDQRFKVISRTDQDWIREKFGYGMVNIHRGDLQQILLEALGFENFFLGKKFRSYEKNGQRIQAQFEDGTLAEGDLILGADGIRSSVREALYSQEWSGQGAPEFRQSQQTCWRGIAKMPLPDFLQKKAMEVWGDQRRFGIISLKGDELYWFAVQSAESGGRDNPETLKEDLKNLFSKFEPLVQQIIANTPPDKIIRNDLFDFKPRKKWYSGRVALIGDAAHPTTPNMGQGACQAVEDAWALQRIFSAEKDPQRAFRLFEERRFEKTRRVTEQSYSFGKMAHIKYGQGLRNFVFQRVPERVARKSLTWLLRID